MASKPSGDRERERPDGPEQEAAGDRSLQRPAAEDHRRDSDVAAPADQRVLEATGAGEQEEAARQARGQPGKVDRLAAQLVDVEARHVGRVRVLADRAHLESPPRAVDEPPDDRDDPVREVEHPGRVEQCRADERDLGEQRDLDAVDDVRSAGQLEARKPTIPSTSTLSTSPTTNWSAGRRWLMLACTSATRTPADHAEQRGPARPTR